MQKKMRSLGFSVVFARCFMCCAVFASLFTGCYNLDGGKDKDRNITEIRLNVTSKTLSVGDTYALTVTFTPANASDKRVRWSTSDATVATVSDSGVVSAKTLGTAVITATAVDGEKKAVCVITVAIPITGISLDQSTKQMSRGDTFTLTATVTPADATNKTVVWSSSDSSIATVDANGLVTAVGTGTATIRAVTQDGGFSAACGVAVDTTVVPVTAVALSSHSQTIPKNATYSPGVTVSPPNATNTHVVWTSDTPSVADVSADGMITGYSGGTAHITAITSDGGFRDTIEIVVTVPVTGVTISNTSRTIPVGGTFALSAQVTPSDATNPSVTWSSSNTSIATVDNSGTVTAVAPGVATITVETADGGYSDSCVVTVPTVQVSVSGVALSNSTLQLNPGDTATLIATVLPANAADKTVTWSSSNPSVATVTSNGTVSAVAQGSASITVTTNDGGYTAVCTVAVNVPIVAVSGISVNVSSQTMRMGTTFTPVVTISPADASNTSVSWTSDDTNVVTVSPAGVITAVNGGTAHVTVTTADGGYSAVITITVTIPVTGITLSDSSKTVSRGNTVTLSAQCTPANASDQRVTWSSSNTTVASVDTAGIVTGNAAGSAVITAESIDGGFTASCSVRVIVPVTQVSLNQTYAELNVGDPLTLTAQVSPADADNPAVFWSSSDTSVATVDNSGHVSATGSGHAVITVTTLDGGFTDACNINVDIPVVNVTGITLNTSSVNLNKSDSITLSATVSPANASDPTVLWSSSNTAVATVTNMGIVTGVGGGTAVITATTQNGGFTATCSVTVTVPVTGVTISQNTLSINKGATAVLTAAVSPSDATSPGLSWSSNSASVATVSNGTVTAVGAGTAVITVTSGNNISDQCTVTVSVPVTGVSLSPSSVTVARGATVSVTPTITPADATNKSIIWTSGNNGVAAVDSQGNITGVGAGTAAVTARTVDGGYTASTQVTVFVSAAGVTLDNTLYEMTVGDTVTLNALVQPPDAANTSVTWASSDTTVATVTQSGVVNAVGSGTTIIRVTTADGGFTASCTVNVDTPVVPVTGVTLNMASNTVPLGTQFTLIPAVSPADATDPSISWSSSNSSVASVDMYGAVTANAKGTAVIRVTTTSGGYTASCTVTVVVPVTSIALNRTSLSLNKGNTFNLTATVSPSNASDPSVTWISSNTAAAQVNASGVVTAVGSGSALITASAADGTVTASCSVTVNVPVTGISFSSASPLPVVLGSYYGFTADITPDDATNTTIIWSSSNPSSVPVDSNGRIYAQSAGSAIITATTQDGGFTAQRRIDVYIPLNGITASPNTCTVKIGESQDIAVIYAPSNASDQRVTWASNNTAVATVSASGRITGVAAGTAVITVSSVYGSFSDTITVTVVKPVTGVSITNAPSRLKTGSPFTLLASVTPSDATNKAVTWSSSNNAVTTVDQNGVVTGVSSGNVTITVQTQDGGFSASATIAVYKAVTGVSINPSFLNMTLLLGDEQLTALVSPSDADNKAVTWASSNPLVATVSQTGAVHALLVGTTVITATTADGGFVASCNVAVSVPIIAATGITVQPTSKTMARGDTFQLTATVQPSNATNKAVIWMSSDITVATVSPQGIVTAVGPGSARITASAAGGTNVTGTCDITVTVPVTGVQLNRTTASLAYPQTVQLTASVVPADATGTPSWSWTSSNNAAATVSSTGLVSSVSGGIAVITATEQNSGKSAQCVVTVTVPVTGITMTPGSGQTTTISRGSSFTITAAVSPQNATNQTIIWSSSNTGVAMVSGTGTVLGVAAGSAVITASTEDGGFSASTNVTVTVPVSGVLVSPAIQTLASGASVTLTASVLPNDATNKSVVWTSSNTAAATVDSAGKVTGVAAGSAVITAKTVDGNFTSSCAVTVYVRVTGVTVTPSTTSLVVGQTAALSGAVVPANATNQTLSWQSSNPLVATVSAAGLVTVLSAGSATITATSADGGYTAACAVTVTNTIPVLTITITPPSSSMGRNATKQLSVTIFPANATNQAVTWSSSNTNIATVSATGVVTSKAVGIVTITATAADGSLISGIATVRVKND